MLRCVVLKEVSYFFSSSTTRAQILLDLNKMDNADHIRKKDIMDSRKYVTHAKSLIFITILFKND